MKTYTLDLLHGHPLDRFTRAYLTCALWASTGDDRLPLDRKHSDRDFAPEAVKQACDECARFQVENYDAIAGGDSDRAGHDFWLTRNRHGAGFWDGDWEDTDGKTLTDASHKAGERDVYKGDDGQLYFTP